MARHTNSIGLLVFANYLNCCNDSIYLFVHLFWLQVRLPPEVNRILYVKNLPYKITAEDMYDIFGKYGAIRQIRV